MLTESPREDQTASMPPFRFLEHPADVGFEAFGATRQEVFVNAALALTDLRVDLAAVIPREATKVGVRGGDWAGLLVNWLSEVLYLEDAEGWLFSDFKFSALEERNLAGAAWGEKVDPVRHHLKSLVKAITYHQLALERQGDLWRAQVFVDV
jgi:SHS2 domain-containing protein